ncbi:hypothetical protein [Streptomyces asiaticus]|uniref:hypothetical protein n=1 Tax=Streptomyces asiaticus TaxID=114695 RepID=UPI001BA6AA55|nr:hypothetical protein [Streptomyces asiaticus]
MLRKYVVKPVDMPLSRYAIHRRGGFFPADVDLGDGMGKRSHYFRTLEAAEKAVRKLNGASPTPEERAAKLEKDITELETWHHAWRLEHDEDYRALHPGEWCTVCENPITRNVDHWRCRTEVERREQRRRAEDNAERQAEAVTPEARRAATRRMAEWGRGA